MSFFFPSTNQQSSTSQFLSFPNFSETPENTSVTFSRIQRVSYESLASVSSTFPTVENDHQNGSSWINKDLQYVSFGRELPQSPNQFNPRTITPSGTQSHIFGDTSQFSNSPLSFAQTSSHSSAPLETAIVPSSESRSSPPIFQQPVFTEKSFEVLIKGAQVQADEILSKKVVLYIFYKFFTDFAKEDLTYYSISSIKHIIPYSIDLAFKTILNSERQNNRFLSEKEKTDLLNCLQNLLKISEIDNLLENNPLKIAIGQYLQENQNKPYTPPPANDLGSGLYHARLGFEQVPGHQNTPNVQNLTARGIDQNNGTSSELESYLLGGQIAPPSNIPNSIFTHFDEMPDSEAVARSLDTTFDFEIPTSLPQDQSDLAMSAPPSSSSQKPIRNSPPTQEKTYPARNANEIPLPFVPSSNILENLFRSSNDIYNKAKKVLTKESKPDSIIKLKTDILNKVNQMIEAQYSSPNEDLIGYIRYARKIYNICREYHDTTITFNSFLYSTRLANTNLFDRFLRDTDSNESPEMAPSIRLPPKQ